MIYECDANHISFSKDNLIYCGMKGCSKPVNAKSSADIDWFYKINPAGLAINRSDLHRIVEDRNMPQEVKGTIKELFSDSLAKKGTRKWFRI